MDYDQFLASKAVVDAPTGLSVVPALNPALFDFQHDIVNWALRRGRAAIFAAVSLARSYALRRAFNWLHSR